MTKILKNARKLKFQVWQFTSRAHLYDYNCSQNEWLLLIKFKSCPFDVWFVLMFKNIKMFQQNLKLNVDSNSLAQKNMMSWWK